MKIDKTNIVIIGDSNTEGYGLSNTNQTYPYKMGKSLDAKYTIYNMGATGSCVINTEVDGKMMGMPYVKLHKYKLALNIKGDVFIINLGTNDAQDGMDDSHPIKDKYNDLISKHDRFYNDYIRIINDLKSNHPLAKIIICIPIPIRKCIWRKHKQKYLEILIPYIHKISEHFPEIYLIDLHSAILSLDVSKIDSMYLNDGLHLNDKGTTYVSKIIASYIKNNIEMSKL